MPALQHTGLTISSLERSLLFWRDAMGMTVLFEQEKTGGYIEAIVGEAGASVRMAHLAFGGEGPRIELFEYVSPSGGKHVSRPADVGFVHVCVACDDLEDRLGRLVAAGGSAFSAPVIVDTGVNRGGRGVYLRDPDGHVVELFEPPSVPQSDDAVAAGRQADG
jgi:catechol 2,3-dioxygenase-like lactoylglutathione lyase family enzyme